MVLGAGGQVGHQLMEVAKAAGRDMVGLTHSEADICDAGAVAAAIAQHAPASIVTAAYTAVDKAETEWDRAFEVNRDGASVVATVAAKANIPLIHISTHYVFDDSSRIPYAEDDPVNPQGAYARSKEAGERAVRDSHDRHLILRTASLYGSFGANFVKTMLRLGVRARGASRRRRSDRLSYSDWRSRRGDTPHGRNGAGTKLYRLGDISLCWRRYSHWYGFATMIFAAAAKFGRKATRINLITTVDYQTAAPRPAYSVLSTAKLKRVFGISPKPLRSGLAATLARLSRRRTRHERHHPRRWLRLTALPHHHRHQQAAHSGV